ncbi:MAG: bifunctional enoyl-CoA hydratase/phosphate acetyltransferase [Betaproteobacteria bacterium]
MRALPRWVMTVRPHFQRLVERVRLRPALSAGFVFPCDSDSLQFALSGAFAGFLAPILIGPEARIRDVAAQAGLDISRLPIADTEDSPAAAADRAAELAGAGHVRALVKGALGIDDLLPPAANNGAGLRTDRRLSHAYFVDLPGRPEGILFADAVLNVTPTLAAKRDILQNTLELASAIGIATPHVAVLAAMNTPNESFPSTLDAAALRTMANEGFFPGSVVQGPLTADSALSADAARSNGVSGEVAGRPDIMIAPSLEAASLLLRALTVLTGGFAAGVVLGARVPIIAPAGTDSMEVRIASCVLAALHADRPAPVRKSGPPAALSASSTTASGHATA